MEINAINTASVLHSFQQETTNLLQKNRWGGPVWSLQINTALGFPRNAVAEMPQALVAKHLRVSHVRRLLTAGSFRALWGCFQK